MTRNKVEDAYTEGYETINENEGISSAIRLLKELSPPALVVEDNNNNISGILTRRWTKRSRLDSTETSVRTLTVSAPSVQISDDISEAARRMVEGEVPILLVYAGEALKGFLTRDALVSQVISDEWGKKKVSEVMTENPVTARPYDSIARILDIFNTYGISHAPVLEKGQLVGIVSIQDIFDVVYRNRNRQQGAFGGVRDRGGYGERKGEKGDLTHIEVSSVMSSPVVAIRPHDTMKDAVEKMTSFDISSLAVLEDDELVGILTKRDFLEPVAQRSMEDRRMSVQFSMKPGIRLKDEEKAAMLREFESFVRRYKDVVGIGGLFVHIRRHGPVSKGNQLIQARLHFRTAQMQCSSSCEAWSVEEAYQLALDRLERKVIEHKTTKLDEEHSQRHIEGILRDLM